MTNERKIIHDIHNCLNVIKLNCSCLGLFTRDETVQGMDSISESTDQIVALLHQLDDLRESETPAAPAA